MTTKSKIYFFCVPIFIFFEILFTGFFWFAFDVFDRKLPAVGYELAFSLAFIIWAAFFFRNLYWYFALHVEEYSLRTYFTGGSNAPSLEKKQATYPSVSRKLLTKNPCGVVFGKHNGRYVCKNAQEDGHVFVIGGSGSGKSSCLVIPTLLVNPYLTVFAIDIKGELHKKSVRHGSQNVKIFDPADRNSYGYDPFYRLGDNPSNQEILETMQLISQSLVSIPADIRDPFWKLSARSLLTGLLIYYYRQGITNFIDIVDQIMSKPIKEVISDAIERSTPYDTEYRYLIEFSNMAETTLSGIYMELSNHINIFAADADIRFALRDNYLKLSPRDLENQISVYISIREEKLTSYYDVMQLIINQMLAELERRPENSHRVLFIIDELARLVSAGKLERLMDAARTLRSRKVVLFLITQSMESLMTAFNEHEVTDLKDNCAYTVVLSAHSMKTQKMIQNWCGTYQEKRTSWSGGLFDGNTQYTYEEKSVVSPGDLMQLQLSGDLILISPYGYNRIKKTPYYLDRQLKLLADNVAQYNQIFEEV